jgi:signal transduction histidine kinase
MSQVLAKVPQPAATSDSSSASDRHLTLTAASSYSEIEVETMEFCPAEISLPSFLDEIVNLFRTRAQSKGIAFTYQNRDRLPDRVQVDPRQLRKILEHLLNYAIQITEAGGVTFTVEVLGRSSPSQNPAPDSQLRFQVEDTGCGLTAEALDLEALESPSQPSNPHLTGDRELGFIQQLIGRMGSKLHAHSLPGVGSLVWMDITFPATCYLPLSERSTDRGREMAVSQCQNDRPPPLRRIFPSIRNWR